MKLNIIYFIEDHDWMNRLTNEKIYCEIKNIRNSRNNKIILKDIFVTLCDFIIEVD